MSQRRLRKQKSALASARSRTAGIVRQASWRRGSGWRRQVRLHIEREAHKRVSARACWHLDAYLRRLLAPAVADAVGDLRLRGLLLRQRRCSEHRSRGARDLDKRVTAGAADTGGGDEGVGEAGEATQCRRRPAVMQGFAESVRWLRLSDTGSEMGRP